MHKKVMSLIGRAAQSKTVSPPWTNISSHSDRYLDAGMLPSGVGLAEPSKLKEKEVRALLRHWVSRQVSGKGPDTLRFTSFLNKDMEIVPAAEEMSDEEPLDRKG